MRNDFNILSDKLEKLEYERDADLQQTLEHNVVINGIEESQQEDTNKIVQQIAQSLNITVTVADIKTAARKNTTAEISGLPRSIMVAFGNKQVRDEFLKSKTKLTTLLLWKQRNKPSNLHRRTADRSRKVCMGKIWGNIRPQDGR